MSKSPKATPGRDTVNGVKRKGRAAEPEKIERRKPFSPAAVTALMEDLKHALTEVVRIEGQLCKFGESVMADGGKGAIEAPEIIRKWIWNIEKGIREGESRRRSLAAGSGGES